MNIPVVDTHRLSPTRKLFYAILVLSVVGTAVAYFAGAFHTPGIIIAPILILMPFNALLGENYVIVGHVTLGPEAILFTPRNGSTQVYMLRELQQVHVWLDGFKGDERGSSLDRRWLSGIGNSLAFGTPENRHYYQLLLQRSDIPALRECLRTWFSCGYDLRLDDATQQP